MRIINIFLLIVLLLAAQGASALDGERMMEMTREQCKFGPRVPGTPAHEACRIYLIGKIKESGLTPWEQPFKATLPLSGRDADCVNLWGLPAADGPTTPALVLSAHWDTRPWADQERGGGRPPMDGANDGAAAAAAVVELARALRSTAAGANVAIALWDAEDAGVNRNDNSWALGARHAAAHPPAWIARVRLGINLDMVGGEELELYPETYSMEAARGAVDELWRLGGLLAPRIFRHDDTRTVLDDHVPWIRRGTPWIDLVGINYRWWHTSGDRPEHCQAQTLAAVTEVVYNFVVQGKWKK